MPIKHRGHTNGTRQKDTPTGASKEVLSKRGGVTLRGAKATGVSVTKNKSVRQKAVAERTTSATKKDSVMRTRNVFAGSGSAKRGAVFAERGIKVILTTGETIEVAPDTKPLINRGSVNVIVRCIGGSVNKQRGFFSLLKQKKSRDPLSPKASRVYEQHKGIFTTITEPVSHPNEKDETEDRIS